MLSIRPSSASTTMTFSVVVHGVVPNQTQRRSLFTRSRSPDAIPVPPSLINSPYLSSPNSIFLRKSSAPRWPSQREDEWLRDMVPMDRSAVSDVDTRSDSESSSSTPSPAASEGPNPFGSVVVPPSPMLRPRSVGPADPTPAKRALSGPGAALSPHS